jgi:hypothetical protein
MWSNRRVWTIRFRVGRARVNFAVDRTCDHGGVTDDADDLDDALHDAHRASSNSVVLVAITVAFGVVAFAEPSRLPAWVISAWFIVVIPLTLLLMFVHRRRYRHALEAQAALAAAKREHF